MYHGYLNKEKKRDLKKELVRTRMGDEKGNEKFENGCCAAFSFSVLKVNVRLFRPSRVTSKVLCTCGNIVQGNLFYCYTSFLGEEGKKLYKNDGDGPRLSNFVPHEIWETFRLVIFLSERG